MTNDSAFKKLVKIIEDWQEDAIDEIKEGNDINNNAHIVNVLHILIMHIRLIEDGKL